LPGKFDAPISRTTFNRVIGIDETGSSEASVSLSEYALRVWVIGPRGTQPIPNALLQ
jgi:hypothetical protein